VNVRAGILIIGSLIWDARPERESWRQSRLRINQAMRVGAPIRYGRCSPARGNTFTMTFDAGATPGRALLVPCREPITSSEALISEAEQLWRAEFPDPEHRKQSWGSVGVLFRATPPPHDLALAWAEHCRRAARPHPPVDRDGLLGIPWPRGTADIDLLLAVANRSASSCPSPEEVADAWTQQHEGHERYFFENLKHGIRTSEDGLIWRRIEETTPAWLDKDEHREVVALLRGGHEPGPEYRR
jgi:hypothetical protein